MAAGLVSRLPSLVMLAVLLALAAGIQSYSLYQLLFLLGLLLFSAGVLASPYIGSLKEFHSALLLLFFLAGLLFSYGLPRPFFSLPLFVSGLGLVATVYRIAGPKESEEGESAESEEEEPEKLHKVVIEHLPELSPGEIDEKLHPYVSTLKGKTYHVPDCPMIKKVKKKSLMHLDHYHARKLRKEPCACVKIYTHDVKMYSSHSK